MKRVSLYDKQEVELLISAVDMRNSELLMLLDVAAVGNFVRDEPEDETVSLIREKLNCLQGIKIRLQDVIARFDRDEREQAWLR